MYSDGGRTVVINMKGWKWSDGETVDAQDVIFWLHMMEAEPDNYYGYVPGDIPQDITSMAATGPEQVTLHLNSGYSSLWYTYNELSQITPMPAAWDVTALHAKPGSGGCATDSAADHWARCKAVPALQQPVHRVHRAAHRPAGHRHGAAHRPAAQAGQRAAGDEPEYWHVTS